MEVFGKYQGRFKDVTQKNKITVILLIIFIILTIHVCPINTSAETFDGERNIETEIIAIPRGNPTKIKDSQKRTHEHSAFESTGLFLYQGEEVEITLEDEPENLELRIGQWGGYTAIPYILTGTQTKPFTNGIFKLSKGTNRFKRSESGGMIYLVNYSDTKTERITIKGGVKVPHYIDGVTAPEEFEEQLNTYKDIPFMEMESSEVIATIRIDRAKDIFSKNGQVKKFVDMFSKTAKLASETSGFFIDGAGTAKKSNQRIHLVNPSFGAGQLFSTNYFIGIHSGTTKDRTIFSSSGNYPDWGLSHEIGHTYQDKDYLWKNMAEVTVNIFADYIQKNWTLTGTGRYDAVNSSNGSRKSVKNYFSKLEKDPTWTYDRETLESSDYHFAVLGLYLTLPRVFGYDFYQILNQNYRSLTYSDTPKNELEMKQTFIVLASLTAKRNLLPYFDYWKFTVTDETRTKIEKLNLQPLEKEIWKDILASEAEEKNGTYRITTSMGPYSIPTGELKKEIVQLPFEESQDPQKYSQAFSKLYSDPVDSPTRIKTGGGLSQNVDFGIKYADIYLINDLAVQNKFSIPLNILPGNSYVMSGQKGVYATLGYNSEKKRLVFIGNAKKILENIPNTIYPKIKIYSKDMKTVKKEVVGYGKNTGIEIATALNNEKVEIGDIIELYHREASKRVTRYKNNVRVTTDKDTYYYKIQDNGWEEVNDPYDFTSIEVKDTLLGVGDYWNPADNLVSATDKTGNEIGIEKIKVEGSVDTERLGAYSVTYNVGGVKKTAVITVKAGPDSFRLEAVPSFTFDRISIGEVGKAQVEVGEKLGLEIADYRGTGGGWTLQVSMTDFLETSTEKPEVFTGGWNLVIPKGSVVSKNTDPSKLPEAKQVTINESNTNQTVFFAEKDKGLGTYSISFMDEQTPIQNAVRLSIPAYAKIGKYQAQLTWSLIDAPTR